MSLLIRPVRRYLQLPGYLKFTVALMFAGWLMAGYGYFQHRAWEGAAGWAMLLAGYAASLFGCLTRNRRSPEPAPGISLNLLLAPIACLIPFLLAVLISLGFTAYDWINAGGEMALKTALRLGHASLLYYATGIVFVALMRTPGEKSAAVDSPL